MSKLTLRIYLALSVLGVIFGISSFFVFFVAYHNYTAGTWGALSGVFAAICLFLHYQVWRRRLEAYYSEESLGDLSVLGVVVAIFSSAFFIWYIFTTLYWHIPMMPISGSSVISAVWTFMTVKWGATLGYITNKYRIRMRLGMSLIEGDDDTPEAETS